MSIIYPCDQMSVIKRHLIIRCGLVSQELSLLYPPPYMLFQCNRKFPLRSDVPKPTYLLIMSKIICCYCGEVVLKSQESHCRNLWEELTDCILYIRSEIRIKFWCRQFAAPHVEGLWQAMGKTKLLPVYG